MTDSTPSSQLFRRAALILIASFFVLVHAVLITLGCPNGDVIASSSKTSRALCSDDHYKYLVPLLIPSGAYYVIANWVGWEYFRYA